MRRRPSGWALALACSLGVPVYGQDWNLSKPHIQTVSPLRPQDRASVPCKAPAPPPRHAPMATPTSLCPCIPEGLPASCCCSVQASPPGCSLCPGLCQTFCHEGVGSLVLDAQRSWKAGPRKQREQHECGLAGWLDRWWGRVAGQTDGRRIGDKGEM